MSNKTTYAIDTEFNVALGWLTAAAVSITSWVGIA